MDMVEQLMALFCDMSDMGDHMEHHMDHGDMDHDDMDHDMDHGMDHDMDHDEWSGEHDMDDVNNRKDEHFCRRAKQMMRELHDYHKGDRHHKNMKAEEWGGRMHDTAWDMFGWDSATSLTTYGVAVIAAVSATLF